MFPAVSGQVHSSPLNMVFLQGWVFNVIPWLVAIPSSLFSGCLSDHLISQGRASEEQISELPLLIKQPVIACPNFSLDPHRLRYSLSEEADAGTLSDTCLVVLCVLSVWSHCGFSSTQSKVYECPLSCLHLYIMNYLKFWFVCFLCAFIPLLVFLHGCVQCVYTSSMWQHHLPLGCSICFCHHGPHHLQSQVLAPRMSPHSVSRPDTAPFLSSMWCSPKVSLSVLCFVLLFCFILVIPFKPLHSFPSLWGQHYIAASLKC